MDANLLLWIGQAALAVVYAGAAYQHSIGFDAAAARRGMGWLAAVGRERMRIIAGLEVLGAVGLVLPAATGILPWLTPLAATSFTLLMLCAAVFHSRRAGERQNVTFNVVLGAVAALVAYGRFVVAPF
jgi:hypothetical protein